jgi:hypothetical protein
MGWSKRDCCADCFWDRDAEEKKVKRANPKWQFQAAFSSAKVLFNKSDEEALAIALHEVVKKQKIENLH